LAGTIFFFFFFFFCIFGLSLDLHPLSYGGSLSPMIGLSQNSQRGRRQCSSWVEGAFVSDEESGREELENMRRL
jgi:hypothetical protein